MNTQDTIKKQLAERFADLPKSVQDAITSASVEKKLRALSQKHKLHLDQWVLLENEIMLTLLGIDEPENMVANVQKQVRVNEETARAIVGDIVQLIFEPIRTMMQKGLPTEDLDRKTTKSSLESNIGTLVKPQATEAPAPVRASGDPAKHAPSDLSGPAYEPGKSSLTRKNVQGDPYREPID